MISCTHWYRWIFMCIEIAFIWTGLLFELAYSWCWFFAWCLEKCVFFVLVLCPSYKNLDLRLGFDLCAEEKDFICKRKKIVAAALKNILELDEDLNEDEVCGTVSWGLVFCLPFECSRYVCTCTPMHYNSSTSFFFFSVILKCINQILICSKTISKNFWHRRWQDVKMLVIPPFFFAILNPPLGVGQSSLPAGQMNGVCSVSTRGCSEKHNWCSGLYSELESLIVSLGSHPYSSWLTETSLIRMMLSAYAKYHQHLHNSDIHLNTVMNKLNWV